MPWEKKIDDTVLISMVQERKTDKEIAEFFNCSDVAVWKHRKRLKKAGKLKPISDKQLTEQQRQFVEAIEQGHTPTEAVKAVYHPGEGHIKDTIARVMNVPAVKDSVIDIMERNGLKREDRVKRLKTHVDNDKKPEVSLRALDMAFKLADDYPAAKSVQVNVNMDWFPVDLDAYKVTDATVVDAPAVIEAEETEEEE